MRGVVGLTWLHCKPELLNPRNNKLEDGWFFLEFFIFFFRFTYFLFLGFGLVACASISSEQSVLSLHIFVMVAFTLVLFAMTHDYDGKSELSRIEGIALLLAFIAYDSYVVLQNVSMD